MMAGLGASASFGTDISLDVNPSISVDAVSLADEDNISIQDQAVAGRTFVVEATVSSPTNTVSQPQEVEAITIQPKSARRSLKKKQVPEPRKSAAGKSSLDGSAAHVAESFVSRLPVRETEITSDYPQVDCDRDQEVVWVQMSELEGTSTNKPLSNDISLVKSSSMKEPSDGVTNKVTESDAVQEETSLDLEPDAGVLSESPGREASKSSDSVANVTSLVSDSVTDDISLASVAYDASFASDSATGGSSLVSESPLKGASSLSEPLQDESSMTSIYPNSKASPTESELSSPSLASDSFVKEVSSVSEPIANGVSSGTEPDPKTSDSPKSLTTETPIKDEALNNRAELAHESTSNDPSVIFIISEEAGVSKESSIGSSTLSSSDILVTHL